MKRIYAHPCAACGKYDFAFHEEFHRAGNARGIVMHPYMVFQDTPAEGAALVFAANARAARAKAWKNIGWLDCEYIELRATRLRKHEKYLTYLQQILGDVIDCPPICPVCEIWGAPLNADGNGCDNCGGDDLPPGATSEDNDMQWLDDQEFYELMQAYRHAPLTDPAGTVAAFEAVKQIIRDKCEERDEWPDSRRDCDGD